MEQKLEKIRDAAGLSGKSVSIEEWTDMLEGDWDDDEWNEQMQARFGEDYYEKDDNLTDANIVEPSKAKLQKPKWDDDIDINDLVPEFNEEDDPIIVFRDSDDEQSQQPGNAKRNRAEARNQARRDRRIIEALADQSLPLPQGQFRRAPARSANRRDRFDRCPGGSAGRGRPAKNRLAAVARRAQPDLPGPSAVAEGGGRGIG